MSKVSVFARHTRELIAALTLIAFVVLTAGCGSSAPAPTSPPIAEAPPPPPPPVLVEGVATPTSVAVVTATNTQ